MRQVAQGLVETAPVRGALGLLAAGLAALVAYLVLMERLEARRRRRDAERAPGTGNRSPSPSPASAPAPGSGHPRCAWPGSTPPAPGTRGEEVLALFGDLRPGDALARWALDWIGEEWRGAVRVGLLDAEGRGFEVELRRLAPDAPAPPAVAGEVGVYLIHVASGAVTPEEQGLGAMALASYLEGVGAPAPAWLAPHGATRSGR